MTSHHSIHLLAILAKILSFQVVIWQFCQKFGGMLGHDHVNLDDGMSDAKIAKSVSRL